MIVLGLDTATADTSVALLSDTDGLELSLARHHRPAPGERPGHAAQLLGLAAAVLHEASLTWGAVDRIAVGVGPGTFTGLRIGVATARALAQASGAQLAGVSTPQALAQAAAVPGGAPVLACVDARRGEVFAAAWSADGTGLLDVRAVAPAALAALAASLGVRPLAVGDGAVRFREAFDGAADVPDDDDARHHVDALAICRLARFAPAAARDSLMPDYVRAPDAKRRVPAAAPLGGPA